MKRHTLLTIAAALCVIIETVSGEMRVSSEEARNAASEYYQQVQKDADGDIKAGEPELFSLVGIAEMWLVPIDENWILVSSDKRLDPILARFPSSEKPDFQSFSSASQLLISGFEYNLAYVRDSCPECSIHKKWEKRPQNIISQQLQTTTFPSYVTPLLGSLAWNQYGNNSYSPNCDKVYNKYCPVIPTGDCGHALVGCVAVAIGQIMRYWGWPYMTGVPAIPGGPVVEKHFFGWELMPDVLTNNSTLEEANMTASFLRDCGYDLNMQYGASGSGAYNENAFITFIHFGYDILTIALLEKSETPDWNDRLHNELAAGRPVYYTGKRLYEGQITSHAFVLDGYDSDGEYHVNFGWGGVDNAYYNLNAISFYYFFSQKAIMGIQPDPNRYCSSVIITDPVLFDDGEVRAGSITLSGVIVTNSAEYRAYSSTEVRLSNGTEIRNGSTAVLAIKDVPCSSSFNMKPSVSSELTSETNSVATTSFPKKCIVSVSPNPTKGIIRIQSNAELTNIEIYSIDGHCMMRGVQTEWFINHLPAGVYIIRAETSEGEIVQTKILHNK